MKKNLMSVIILALVCVNLVLTAILMFTIVPQTSNANKLIEKVCAAVDLELSSGSGMGTSNIPTENLAQYVLNDGETTNINLAKGEDGKTHYAMISVSLSLNTKSEGYAEYGTAGLDERNTIIMDLIIEVIGQYTKEEFDANRTDIKKEILNDLQSMFGADFIVGVNFPRATTD